MIGVVIVTHSALAQDFVQATEAIVGPLQDFRAVCLKTDEDSGTMNTRIGAAIQEVSSGDGVIVLTDVFGGTPSNLALTFHREGEVEVIMGLNLPMLLKLATQQSGQSVGEVATFITEYGKRNIQLATEILKARPSIRKAPSPDRTES